MASAALGLVFAQNLANSSVGGIPLRHLLMSLTDISSNGFQPLEGELAYDASTSRLAAHLNGAPAFFPKDVVGNRALSQSALTANLTNLSDPALQVISVGSGARFRMTDQSIVSLPLGFTELVATIHAGTPFVGGWNYLYLRNNSGTLSLSTTATFGAPGSAPGVYAYLGSVFVTLNGGAPQLDPVQRVGTHYYYHHVVHQALSVPVGQNQDSLSLPVTAVTASVFALNSSGGCFGYPVGDPTQADSACASGQMVIPRNSAGTFLLNYTGAARSGSSVVDVDLQGYDESVDSIR